jgi:transposase-like protein
VADLKGDGELPKRVVVRRSKYLNNLIEQDHRRIKQRLWPTLGLKSFETANTVIRVVLQRIIGPLGAHQLLRIIGLHR